MVEMPMARVRAPMEVRSSKELELGIDDSRSTLRIQFAVQKADGGSVMD